jgi:Uma2 family endonuclease
MATEPRTRLTVDDLFALPDDEHVLIRELIDGELFVTPTPATRHQRVVLELGAALLAYVKERGGEVFVAPTGVYLSDVNFVEPDVIYIGPEHADRVEAKYVRSAPDLAVEVSSPSTRRRDLTKKLELYERFGFTEYWFVDLDAERIAVRRLEGDRYGPARVLDRDGVLASPLLPGFEIGVATVLGPPPA